MSARKLLFVAAACLFAMAAVAQDMDPRLTQPTLKAAQALLTLRETELAVLGEKLMKREAEWAKYSEPLWKTPE